MRFRKLRNVRVSYAKQGQIFFALVNYADQPPGVRAHIDRLLHDVSGGEAEYERALRDWLIRGVPWDRVLASHYVDGSVLVRLRKKVYESW